MKKQRETSKTKQFFYEYDYRGYVVRRKAGNTKIAVFVDEGTAGEYCDHRNSLMDKYGDDRLRGYE